MAFHVHSSPLWPLQIKSCTLSSERGGSRGKGGRRRGQWVGLSTAHLVRVGVEIGHCVSSLLAALFCLSLSSIEMPHAAGTLFSLRK